MPTTEYVLIQDLLARVDALDAAAVALGAPDAPTLFAWLNNKAPAGSQTNFADPNASALVNVLRAPGDGYLGSLY
jgi:hypothetical protein